MSPLTSKDIAKKLRRHWNNGELLSRWAQSEDFPVFSLGLQPPKPREISRDFTAAQSWVSELRESSKGRYQLEYAHIGGRLIGENEIPVRAIVSSWDEAWKLLGVQSQVADFSHILEESQTCLAARQWAVRHPLRALAIKEDFPTLVRAYQWLDAARDSGRYLREIAAPGLDTKFVENHRGILAQMLAVSRAPGKFETDLGLAIPPSLIRIRGVIPLAGAAKAGEVALREEDWRHWEVPSWVTQALVVENLATYLSVPLPENAIAIWGKGFAVNKLSGFPWLSELQLWYWGDLDGAGFEILHRLRIHFPTVRSVLMDEETLLAHREKWVRETKPPSGKNLGQLTAREAEVYRALVEDRFGEKVRLEQERLNWEWALDHLPWK
ncbi:MAG: DUF2220 family protein [Mobiluncus porci]|uniref:Wadjet anti-phage system protein JetD domain-containing protein n=1 Tax=Mobiluncus porci TaxID=2652278 RepID=UPI0023F56DC8|nr:DUF3322 and DUF2220 domain-containing protein [Mobiluncus porci]MDD7542282.1 DUF2220 family protein [Mobiluncus porci]MDY5749081.1 DUF2220 family protein [Mobiluncus porci]